MVRVVQASSLRSSSHLFEGLSDLETHGSLSLRTRFVFTFFSVAFGVRRLFFSLLFGISNDLNPYFLRIYDPKYYFRSFSKVPNSKTTSQNHVSSSISSAILEINSPHSLCELPQCHFTGKYVI